MIAATHPPVGWQARADTFLDALRCARSGAYASSVGGKPTLYGSAYALLTRYYLGHEHVPDERVRDFILETQDPESGFFVGPELREWTPKSGAVHDREHLLLHLTCAVLPVCQQFGWALPGPLLFARRFLDRPWLRNWLDGRDLRSAWLEGNNILFAGQLLVYLRDVEREPAAQAALDDWFAWLDGRVDPNTGLWGIAEGASVADAVYGGYHQLLVYYHEHHPVKHPERLVDAVLPLQHPDGGFAPGGGGGACEDVDAVDILVNLYKLADYRRAEIRWALRRCKRFILSIQQRDGGFPYGATRRHREFSHMGIPATRTLRGTSAMFSTWFRVHTLALISEVLTDDEDLQPATLHFSAALSMGWHKGWDKRCHSLSQADLQAEQDAAPGLVWHAKGWARHGALLGHRAYLRLRWKLGLHP